MSAPDRVNSSRLRPARALANVFVFALGLIGVKPAVAAIPPAERQVLLNLYSSTNGAGWTTRTNWNGAAGTECTWYGITCDAGENHVDFVDLPNNNLTGTLPALGDLTALRLFSVYSNRLVGGLPALSGLTQLVEFEVFDNQLTGPIPALTGLVNLYTFVVSDNRLTGPIPSLAGLTSLRHFQVADNQLTGTIPDLTGLTGLAVFDVSSNQLTGTLPTLSGLSHLQSFVANDNRLTGTIPSLAGLDALTVIHVERNNLSGAVPAVPAPLNDLTPSGSSLCPNRLDASVDPAWDAATGTTPWYRECLAASIQAVPSLSPFALGALAGHTGVAGLAALAWGKGLPGPGAARRRRKGRS